MARVKTFEQKYRFSLSGDLFPERKLFESRYYAEKFAVDQLGLLDKMYYMVQEDPFTRGSGKYVILILNYV